MDYRIDNHIFSPISVDWWRCIVHLLVNIDGGEHMNPINQWKKEAQEAFSEYKRRDCGNNVYTKDAMCRRCEYAIINAYLDFLCFTKGPRIAGNHRRYVNRGDFARKDEVKIIVKAWNLS